MNEKIKTQSGTIYELVPGGAHFGEETAKLIFIFPADKTYEEVEADLEGNDRIQILDAAGEVSETKIGYTYLDSAGRKKNYVIGAEQVEAGADEETGEAIYTTRDVLGTAMIVELKKADLRAELEAAKAEIANLNETVDMLVIASLGV